MLAPKNKIPSIRCIKTRRLRIDDYDSDGNARIIYDEARRNRVLEHQRRIQDGLRRRKI